MVEHQVRHLLVLGDQTVVGVLTDRDLKRALDPDGGLLLKDELFGNPISAIIASSIRDLTARPRLNLEKIRSCSFKRRNTMSAQSDVGVAQDPAQVDSKHYVVELENEKVRVLRIKYGPHEKSTMHGHPASLAIFLTDAEGRFTYPDGRSEDINVKAGQVMYMDAVVHDPENVGDKPFEVIAVELKV